MSDIKKIKDEFLSKLKENLDLNQINQIKTDLFGKNGLVSSQFKQLGNVAEEERKKPKRAPQPPCKACGSRNIETSPIGEIGTSSFRPGVHLTCRDCGWQITYRG